MLKPTEPSATEPAVSDYRAEAEARGLAAYLKAVAEPPQPPTPAPPAWWESPAIKGNTMKAVTAAKSARPISRVVSIRPPVTREEVLLEAVYKLRALEKEVLDELMKEHQRGSR